MKKIIAILLILITGLKAEAQRDSSVKFEISEEYYKTWSEAPALRVNYNRSNPDSIVSIEIFGDTINTIAILFKHLERLSIAEDLLLSVVADMDTHPARALETIKMYRRYQETGKLIRRPE